MTKTPTIGTYIDEEERKLVEAIESDSYEPGPNQLTPERLQALKVAAQNTQMNYGRDQLNCEN